MGTVDEGGPAFAAGLRTGDQIVAIDGQDCRGGKAYLFYSLALVPAGTILRVGLEGGKTLSITAAAHGGE